MTFIDFFAGIGGFRRGMELAGHTCVGFCEKDEYAVASYTAMHLISPEQYARLLELPLKKRQKEILKEEYRHGEWYSSDVLRLYAGDIPRADCWCLGSPCQGFSVAGKQLGLDDDRSNLFLRITELLGWLKEEERPKYLLIENVKNLLSVDGGWDFARVLSELDACGYDAEWDVLNSKDFGVPQHRERLFIVGHLRAGRTRKVFPLGRDERPTGVEPEGVEGVVRQIGHMSGRYEDNRSQAYRVYDPNGLAPTLSTSQGGGAGSLLSPYRTKNCLPPPIRRSHRFLEGVNVEKDGTSRTIRAQYQKNSVPNFLDKGTRGATAVRVIMACDKSTKDTRILDYANALTAKEDRGVSKLKHLGTAAVVKDGEKEEVRIRKLTPRECFRLQGWTDDYFERAESVNSDCQLYKQAGNGVTVNVVYEIARHLE